MVDNDATEDLMLLLLLVVLEVVGVVDGNGAEPPPEDCDDWFDFVEVWRDRDDAGADHGAEDDVDDVTAATCSSLSTEMSSRKLSLFFVIVKGWSQQCSCGSVARVWFGYGGGVSNHMSGAEW